jgi:tetratricopeptide (TPR) repeat protein
VLTSHTVQSTLGDLFRMQDDIVRRMVDNLALPLAGERYSPSPDAPHNPGAYEFYLRANELARTYEGMVSARTLYEQSIDLDPNYAPAWARLGRCHRVIGKYLDSSPDSDARAEDAFKRAIALNPRLSIAHKFYANLEADTGRARDAVVRLLTEAHRLGNDPELYAGLVHACRYAGLFDESLAAHAEAKRLDPNIITSFEQTLMMKLDVERLLVIDPQERVPGGDDGIRVIGLGMAGRREEARQMLTRMSQRPNIPTFRAWTVHLAAWLDRRPDQMEMTIANMSHLKIFDDPEAIFQEGWMFCDAGDYTRGLGMLQRGVAAGCFAVHTLVNAPQFDPLRDRPEFQAILAMAEAGRDYALASFHEARGSLLLAH